MIAAPLLLLLKPKLPHAVVLTFHDVIERRGPQSVWFDTTVDELKEILDAFKKANANFIRLADLRDAVAGRRSLPPRAVLITFADNYRGYGQLALPILLKRGVPSVQFVHTGFVGSKVGRPKLTWTELASAMKTGYVEVQSQTVSHPADLTTLTDSVLAKEFARSKEDLKRLGQPVYAVAYPNGKFDLRVSQAAKASGYELGFTERLTPVDRSPDAWRIGRYVHTKWRQALRELK